MQGHALLVLAQVAARTGRRAEARESLERATEILGGEMDESARSKADEIRQMIGECQEPG
jgi:hypothetical protein